MLRAGLRRLLVIFLALGALTSVGSLVIGALAHAGVARSLSEGFYAAGAAVLVGAFVLGSRGPVRAEWGDEGRPSHGRRPRSLRRATPEERAEAKVNALALFAVGIVLIAVGAMADPSRRLF